MEAIETSSIAVWPFSIGEEATARHPAWNDLMRIELEDLFRRKNRYARALLTKDAAARYQEWLESHPEGIPRIPQYLVASYLGITPQSLSRIRTQLGLARGGTGAPEADTD
jgi:CRP-like cAMP-binding protein